MHAQLARLLQRLGCAWWPKMPSSGDECIAEMHIQPRIEPGSVLDTIAALNPSTAGAYADAVASGIRQAIAACTIGNPATTTVQALEQIHSLKNAIGPTGSVELLKACEQLRLEVIHSEQRAALAQRFKAVAGAAALLLRNYRRTL